MKRRGFIRLTTMGVSSVMIPYFYSCNKIKVPSYLADFSKNYKNDPLGASLRWFKAARFGLFMYYGVYSLLGRGEWVQFNE
jgi:alpha-L-fucosidase